MIEIKKGHDVSSYFWIMPAKFNYEICETPICDYWEAIQKFREKQISIEEAIVENFLYYFLEKHFDKTFKPNIKRNEMRNKAGECVAEVNFEWNLEDNFYSFEQIEEMIVDIKDVIELMRYNYNDERLTKLKNGFDWFAYIDLNPEIYRTMSKDDMYKYSEDNKNEIIDFYRNFISYMNDMIIEGKKSGYNLISVMGP